MDRIASLWLLCRFIDPDAHIHYVALDQVGLVTATPDDHEALGASSVMHDALYVWVRDAHVETDNRPAKAA